jgi:hypothetical protein
MGTEQNQGVSVEHHRTSRRGVNNASQQGATPSVPAQPRPADNSVRTGQLRNQLRASTRGLRHEFGATGNDGSGMVGAGQYGDTPGPTAQRRLARQARRAWHAKVATDHHYVPVSSLVGIAGAPRQTRQHLQRQLP